MLPVSEKPAPSDTVYTDSAKIIVDSLRIIIYILTKLEIIYKKKTSYSLLNTMQRSHLKVKFLESTIDPFTNSKKQVNFQQLNKRWSCEFPFLAQGCSPKNNTSPLLLLCCLTLDIGQRPNTKELIIPK